MSRGADGLFARAAVRRGFLSPEAAAREVADRDLSRPDAALGEWLVARGLLDPGQRAAIERELAESSGAGTLLERPTTELLPEPSGVRGGSEAATLVGPPEPSRSGSPSAVAATRPRAGGAAPAAGRLGKYELLRELGRGGMGVVYLARDCELGREVALKTALLGDARTPEMVERLFREARTAAALDHPGIVPVHDSGEIDGVPYFAMAYVRGRALDALWRDDAAPDLRERVRILAEVARAVAHAHARGIVHRDLKPANVLLDDQGHVHVLDFGLARRVDEGVRLTLTGQMVGTPQYMPPEQIEGERDKVGPPSDVYALGAMLFEALAGRPPFVGVTSGEVLLLALAQDAPSPRRFAPRVPVDLETICLRALEKEPERRFPDAGAFADDLERWLRGEAIRARPIAWPTLVARRVTRHKTRTALLAILLVAAAWGAREMLSSDRLRARVRADLREKAGLTLATALDLRRQGLPPAKIEGDLYPRLADAVREAEAIEPDRAESAYLLGRMARAVLAFGPALEAQERALAREPGFLPARYERALLLARKRLARFEVLRQRALEQAVARVERESNDLPDPRDVVLPADTDLEEADDEARTLRERLFADLAALEQGVAGAGSGGASAEAGPRLGAAHLACARGFALACGSGSSAERMQARALLRAAVDQDPTLEEAVEAMASLDEAEGSWDAAIATFSLGIERDRGFTPFWTGRARVHLKRGEAAARRDEDPGDDFRAAEADFQATLALDPRQVEAYAYLGQLETKRAEWLADRAEESDAAFGRAHDAFTRALVIEPGNAGLLFKRAMARMACGTRWKGRGENPIEQYGLAERDLLVAVKIQPDSADAWVGLAATHGNWGYWKHLAGEDAEPLYERAAGELDRAIGCNPRLASAWSARAQLRASWALVRGARGGDPVPLYAEAEVDYRKALDLAPQSFTDWAYLGDLLMNRALRESGRHLDAEERYASAAAAHERALALHPESPDAWRSLGLTRLNWAMYRAERGGDPVPLFVQARDAFAQSLRRNARDASAWLRRAALWINWGNHLAETGGEPEALWLDGIADLAHAKELDPGTGETWLAEAKARLALGRHARKRGGDPSAEFERSLAAARECLAREPKKLEAELCQSEVRLTWVFVKRERGEDTAPLTLGSLANLERAEAIHPRNAAIFHQRGLVCATMKVWGPALASYERALELDPGLGERMADLVAMARREVARIAALPPELQVLQSGQDFLHLGLYDRACAAYGEYLRLAEELGPTLPEADRDRLFPLPFRDNANFNRACVCAVLSTGRRNPIDEPREIPEAGAHRDAAFRHLEAALALAPKPRAAVEGDPDLVRLKGDPRWEALLGRLK